MLFLLFTQRAAPSSLTFKLHNSQLYSATYCHSHSHFWAYLAGRAGLRPSVTTSSQHRMLISKMIDCSSTISRLGTVLWIQCEVPFSNFKLLHFKLQSSYNLIMYHVEMNMDCFTISNFYTTPLLTTMFTFVILITIYSWSGTLSRVLCILYRINNSMLILTTQKEKFVQIKTKVSVWHVSSLMGSKQISGEWKVFVKKSQEFPGH